MNYHVWNCVCGPVLKIRPGHYRPQGAVPALLRLLTEGSQAGGDEALAQQIVWALGNIAADSRDMQKAVLEEGVLAPVLGCMRTSAAAAAAAAPTAPPEVDDGSEPKGPMALLRQSAWLLSNLCRPRPQDDKIYVRTWSGEIIH